MRRAFLSILENMSLLDTHHIQCPYCGESIQLVIDCTIPDQAYIEDCFVCCRPINVSVIINENNLPHITVKNENE